MPRPDHNDHLGSEGSGVLVLKHIGLRYHAHSSSYLPHTPYPPWARN